MRHFFTEHRIPLLAILAYALCAHLFLLTNDLPYWDGWIYHIHIQKGDYAFVWNEWENNGRPLIGAIYLWIGQHLGTVSGYHLVVTLAIIASGWLFYLLLVRETTLGRFYSLMAALLGVSYPAYQVHLASTTFTYITALPFFIGGILALLATDSAHTPGRRAGIRLLAHMLFLLSYISEAFPIAALLFPGLVWARHHARQEQQAFPVKTLPRYYLRYADFILIAAAYMAAMWFLMPAQENYAHSRELSFSIGSLASHYSAYLFASLDFNILNLTTRKLHRDINLAIWLGLIALGCTVFRKRIRDPQARTMWAYIVIAFLFIEAIATPFVLAQRKASTYGWDMRHLTGVGFLAGFIWICVLHYFIRNETWRRRVALTLVVFSCLSLSKDYLHWQARGALDHGVIENLRDYPEISKPDAHITDLHRWFFKEIYRAYEWEMMMEEATGRHSNITLTMALDPDAPVITDCPMMLRVLPEEGALRWISGPQYLWNKLTMPDDEMRQWLMKRVVLESLVLVECPPVRQ